MDKEEGEERKMQKKGIIERIDGKGKGNGKREESEGKEERREEEGRRTRIVERRKG